VRLGSSVFTSVLDRAGRYRHVSLANEQYPCDQCRWVRQSGGVGVDLCDQRALSDRTHGAGPTVRPRTRAIKAVGRGGTGLKSAALQATRGKFREWPIRLKGPDSREEIG
jgi:hypothetical protein